MSPSGLATWKAAVLESRKCLCNHNLIVRPVMGLGEVLGLHVLQYLKFQKNFSSLNPQMVCLIPHL